MRVVIDIQSLQTDARHRGIGRYTLNLVCGLLKNNIEDQFILLLNGFYKDSVPEIKKLFHQKINPQDIVTWFPPNYSSNHTFDKHKWHTASSFIKEKFIASLKPDFILVTSLFDEQINAITSVNSISDDIPTAVILYDLIPYIYQDIFLNNPDKKKWYESKIEYLKKADLLFSISNSSGQEAIKYIDYPQYKVFNISSDISSDFKKLNVSKALEDKTKSKYNLVKPFIMCISGPGEHKNIERLIIAFSQLPLEIKGNYQLAIIYKITSHELKYFNKILKRYHIKKDEIIFTGFVPDDDLLILYNLTLLLVVPSLHEGFGLPALEAMRCGAPVVASNCTSLPEVVGLKDALFDPYSTDEIAKIIVKGVTDGGFRALLIDNAKIQSIKFSWDATSLLAIGAMKNCLQNKDVKSISYQSKRLKLALLLSLSHLNSSIYNLSNLKNILIGLNSYYDITIIADEISFISEFADYGFELNRTNWFLSNFNSFERIVYNIDNTFECNFLIKIFNKIPGVILVNSFEINNCYTSDEVTKEIYLNHGYYGLIQKDLQILPCNLSVYQASIGLITENPEYLLLAKKWYGEQIQEKFKVITNAKNNLSPELVGQNYFKAIEGLYKFSKPAYLDIINNLSSAQLIDIGNHLEIAESLNTNFAPYPRKKQILVDISEIVKIDANTGIQRVVKSILNEWLKKPVYNSDWRIEPIYCVSNNSGYFYATKYVTNFLGLPSIWSDDYPIDAWEGDVFLRLDLGFIDQSTYFLNLKNRGVLLYSIIYDILPLTIPSFFPKVTELNFKKWINATLLFDGVLCISRSVAIEFDHWLAKNDLNKSKHKPFVKWFQLGADLNMNGQFSLPLIESLLLISKIKSNPIFLVVSTLEPRKAHFQVLKAFDILWGKGFKINLCFVGKEGWLGKNELSYIKRHSKLNNNFFWLNKVTDHLLSEIYKSSACLIAASYGEGFGLPIVEAAKYKLPILARNIPVFKEVAGTGALYFDDDRKPETIADAVELWLRLRSTNEQPISDNLNFSTWEQSAIDLFMKVIDPNKF